MRCQLHLGSQRIFSSSFCLSLFRFVPIFVSPSFLFCPSERPILFICFNGTKSNHCGFVLGDTCVLFVCVIQRLHVFEQSWFS